MHTGLAGIAGTEDRQHAYVALTRGTDRNAAYVFTLSPKLADPAPGPRPAPELARYDRVTTIRSGKSGASAADGAAADPLGVLAGVLERDGQQLSASRIWRQALADAGHLAVLHAIWAAETAAARDQRYTELFLQALPEEARHKPSHQAKWLWQALRAAELAGLDAGQVLAGAIGGRDLTEARDIASVIGARLRRRTGSLVPLPAGPWSARVPRSPTPGAARSPPRSLR